MPVTDDDLRRYDDFVLECIRDLESLDFHPDTVVWHYTDGRGLLGILESNSLYSTQVSCLNDSSEIRYASSSFRTSLETLLPANTGDAEATSIIRTALDFFKEETDIPANAPLPHFVTCFSGVEDDLSQWRAYSGGENGYAIGFKVADLIRAGLTLRNDFFAMVSYDKDKHGEIANRVATRTVEFYKEGLLLRRAATPEKWAMEFLEVWDKRITSLAPLVKNPCFKAENEFRLIHMLLETELRKMCFLQKDTLLSRHIPLSCDPASGYSLLPIHGIVVGPCRHPWISLVSVNTLLRQKGYLSSVVTASRIPFQKT
ncbi:MAG: DUF2971 domain-containing protein [Terriglobales bacterium]|jgi:hypothetical protein